MYNLPYFTEKNDAVVFEFIQQNYFAIIAGFDGNFPVATHVPLDVKKENDVITLTGHIMKNTTHHKAFLQNNNVMAIFTGPHCYVSASWYEQQEVASTWNYMDVQARGTIQFRDEEETIQIIRELTGQHEARDSAAAFHNLTDEYVHRLVKAIVGFTITVSSVENVFKLSQNRDVTTQQHIIEKLSASQDDGANVIAIEMKKRLPV